MRAWANFVVRRGLLAQGKELRLPAAVVEAAFACIPAAPRQALPAPGTECGLVLDEPECVAGVIPVPVPPRIPAKASQPPRGKRELAEAASSLEHLDMFGRPRHLRNFFCAVLPGKE